MRRKYKEIHKEIAELQVLETLSNVASILDLVRIAAKNSTSFEEFAQILEDTIAKVEEKMNK